MTSFNSSLIRLNNILILILGQKTGVPNSTHVNYLLCRLYLPVTSHTNGLSLASERIYGPLSVKDLKPISLSPCSLQSLTK